MLVDIALFLITFLSFLLPAHGFPMIEARKAAKTASKVAKKKFPIGAIVAIIVVVILIAVVVLVVMMLMKKRKAKKDSAEAQPSLGNQHGYQQANY
jgi:heme/copper-type cytochrome/quinol oxidase subunit 2